MADKAIIEKIKNLMNLANDNPSESEARLAALMAQKLIAKHGVKDNELMERIDEDTIVEVHSGRYKDNAWASWLALAIANNFRCRAYMNNGYEYRRQYHEIVFMGYETDAEAARLTFDRLFAIGKRLADAECRRFRRMYGTARGVKNSFLDGFVSGIRSVLEEQAVALVLVTPKKVNEYADDVTRGFRRSRRPAMTGYSSSANDRGYSAGRDAMRAGQLTA